MAPKYSARYSTVIIGLHWLMLLLIAAAYLFIELRQWFPKGSDTRTLLKSLHYMMGLSVLFLIGLRILLRLTNRTPPIVPAPPYWTRIGGSLMLVLLYAFMITMPLLGWMMLSAEGNSINYFGVQLPPLLSENERWAEQIEAIHEELGEIGYFIIGLHAIAGLLHHYWFKDNTLKRMLPWPLK